MDRSHRKKTELLSPAGSFDILKAVVNAGADAVYAAGNKFGARAYANNFTEEELLAAIDYMHLNGKQLYLTVNTLLKEQEIGELYEYLNPLYEAGLDAVIVQDIGVMHFIREHFPDLPIHASTQMAITGVYGARMLLDAGCSRIVTARELSLEEISNIYEQTGAEIESFVHGALCYCYSGQCLLSSMIGGRSGNRGRCAQPCRLSYELFDNKKEAAGRKQKENYLLSPKDLCTIDLIPQLIQSGIHSFKIEGRMKQAEYAAGVTSIYRKYIDRYEADPERDYKVSEKDHKLLLDLGNRCGFTDGYYTRHNGKDMITFLKPSHEKGNEQLQENIRRKYIQKENKEKIKGILRLFEGNPARLMLEYKGIQTEVTGELVQPALKQPLSRETILDKMNKTGNTPFEFEALELEMEENVFIPVGALNQLRREGLAQLLKEFLAKYRRSSKDTRKSSVQEGTSEDRRGFNDRERSGIPELRVLTETLEQFQVALKQPEVQRIYLEEFAFSRDTLEQQLKEYVTQAQEAGKECYLALPYIFRMETAEWFRRHWQQVEAAGADGYLVRNFEELQFLKEMGIDFQKVQGDYNIYGYSNEARKGLSQLSLGQFTLPVELNFSELRRQDCTSGEMILYGYQPLMVSAQCVHKNTAGCDRQRGIFYMKDRYGKLFPVKNQCEDCYNIIYNISPLSLLHHFREVRSLNPAGVRLSFTLESAGEAERIFGYYREAAATGTVGREQYLTDFTNGHFKRGVE